MSKNDLFSKNIELSESVANFLVKNPSYLKKYGNSSFVVFTENDNDLNTMNQNLLSSLLDEGKKVVIATLTSDNSKPWTFELAN